MKISVIRALTLFILVCSLASCGHKSIAERVASAELAMSAEDVASTRRLCDEIVGEKDGNNNIEAVTLGRLSILYMQLYDRTDDNDALDQAVNCYRSAFEQNADSARYYYSHLPADQDKYAMSLSTLIQSIDNPADLSDDYSENAQDEPENPSHE